MSKKSLNTAAGRRIFNNRINRPGNLPFTFRYGGELHNGLQGLFARRKTVKENGKTTVTTTARVDKNLRIRIESAYIEEFGQCEYTVWFENVGNKPTDVISDVYALDMTFAGKNPVLRGCLGDHDNWYAGYEKDLGKGDEYFLSLGGRATHIVFPYFDLCHGRGGTMIALGWAGTWEALFSSEGDVTRVKAKTDVSLDTVLLPGEKIRTGLVVLLPYKNRNYADATNLWRSWFMKYNLPKADGENNMLKPFSTSCFASDTGLPNSDGSISERSFTWKPTLDKLIAENMKPDFRWFDAGWYYDPENNSVPENWWITIGTWELDREKWPGDSFLQSNTACHKEGMKVLVWFEPERVTNVPALCKNYGYKEEWSIGDGISRTNDLGNPDCLAWTLGRITKFLGEHGVDMYREDNNSDPGFAWPYKDGVEAQKYGLKRSGITENKCICGHYALWDGIIDYCKKNGKCTFVDSCASGGGRNDIESMRRGIPLMRSDFDRTSSSMRLSQTSTFCRWIPFHGSSTKETEHQLDVSKGAGSSPYVVRASYLPIYNYGEEFTHNKELDYDLMRKNYNEWKSVKHLLIKDMYVLTPWRHHTDKTHWTAFAYDDPETGESILLAFRMEEAESVTFTAKLPFADKSAKYELKDADSGKTEIKSGAELLKGITITLPEPKSSVLIYIKRL
ncbi:MAG: alpha-galactosidase [Clostridia bacterium]|nr:alpha-galactosidase [Clostridia bacterium]